MVQVRCRGGGGDAVGGGRGSSSSDSAHGCEDEHSVPTRIAGLAKEFHNQASDPDTCVLGIENGNIEDFRIQRLGGVAAIQLPAKASWRMNGLLGGQLEPPTEIIVEQDT